MSAVALMIQMNDKEIAQDAKLKSHAIEFNKRTELVETKAKETFPVLENARFVAQYVGFKTNDIVDGLPRLIKLFLGPPFAKIRRTVAGKESCYMKGCQFVSLDHFQCLLFGTVLDNTPSCNCSSYP